MAKSHPICSVKTCDKPAHSNGMCSAHHHRWKRHGDPLAGGPFRERRWPVCKVEGCTNKPHGRGLCLKHWERHRRNGDPLAGRTECGRPIDYFASVVLIYNGDDCLIWPFGTSRGYAQITVDGVHQYVSRMICEIESGPPPTPDHEAAHSCGNGKLGCVNPRHIRWATRSENELDKVDHGTSNRGIRNGNAKLTDDDIRQIRCMSGKTSQRAIATKFGVTQSIIWRVLSGRSWKHVS